jgi:hypothetical protein
VLDDKSHLLLPRFLEYLFFKHVKGTWQRIGTEAMKTNVGGIDKALRILVGLALIGWAFLGGPVWAWIGIVPLATGLVGFCPAYTILGLRTSKK